MKLETFLKEVGGDKKNIITYSGDEAIKKVEQNGCALQYVHNQTLKICKIAVKQNGYALQYVHNQNLGIC